MKKILLLLLVMCFLSGFIFGQTYPGTQVATPVKTYTQNDTKGVWVLGAGAPVFTPTAKMSHLYFDYIGQSTYFWNGSNWIDWSLNYTWAVENGIYRSGTTARLGGDLTETTEIQLNGNDFVIAGDGGLLFDSDNDILIHSGLNDGSGSVDISGFTAVGLAANDNISLNSQGGVTVVAANDISINTNDAVDLIGGAAVNLFTPELYVNIPSSGSMGSPLTAPLVKTQHGGQTEFAPYGIDVTGIVDGDILVYDDASRNFLPAPPDVNNQLLSLVGDDISISNGNAVTLPDPSPVNELQALSLSGSLLSLTGSGTVDLSAVTSPVFVATNGLELVGSDLGIINWSAASDGEVPAKDGSTIDWVTPLVAVSHGASLTGDGNGTPLDVSPGGITSAEIASGTIAQGNMGTGSVGTAQIINGDIQGADIAALTITNSNIAALTITGGKIAASTITQAKMANNSIGTAQIIANDIQFNDIATGAVRTSTILDRTIGTIDLSSLGATTGQIMQYNGTDWVPIDFPINRNQEYSATLGQTIFTLTFTPTAGSSLQVFRNGLVVPKNAATLAGNTVTYIPAQNSGITLLAGDRINIFYQK